MRLKIYIILFFIVICPTDCSYLLETYYRDTVPSKTGTITVNGIHHEIIIKRDDMGIPFIEADNMEDLAFGIGYANASDRLAQMIGMKLISQGRISEMAGPAGLEMDYFIRSINCRKAAEILYQSSSDNLKHLLDIYCRGVNFYIDNNSGNLPPGFDTAGYKPDKWEPMDSASIFILLTLSLACNLHEELDMLNIVQRTGSGKAAWLCPIYPDEPIPFDEMKKLEGIDLKTINKDIKTLLNSGTALSEISMLPAAASNNWVISKNRTEKKNSIFSNDTHLSIMIPSVWHMMHVRCPGMDSAGISLAGLPGIVAGYNSRIAWGMTMVMADNQDVFLEKLSLINGELHYLHKDKWKRAVKREEVFEIKGKDKIKKIIFETVHGPLLNSALFNVTPNDIMPSPVDLPYGIALSWAMFEPDQSLECFFNLNTAASVNDAMKLLQNVRSIPLNVVCADRDNIGWQVTGRYPVRKKGRGKVACPGWTGEYDWNGYLDVNNQPRKINPPEGYICTANNRTVPASYPHTLSSSWHYPERAERINNMILQTDKHNLNTAIKMQLDTYSLYSQKIKASTFNPENSEKLKSIIRKWSDDERKSDALNVLDILRGFDGNMSPGSTDASVYSAFLRCCIRNTFLDELGPDDGRVWRSFSSISRIAYSAQVDHLLARGDESPFWDDVNTEAKEGKFDIIAKSLADTPAFLEKESGSKIGECKWGRLHTYSWISEGTKMSARMGFLEKTGMKLMNSFFNRGPYPAGGDHETVNVAAYNLGNDFGVGVIPEMRIVVDFSLDEPVFIVNSTGQSDNPVSPHYDDGIFKFLKGEYQPFPFRDENINKQYRDVLILKPQAVGDAN